MASKPKSETPPSTKVSPATPRVGRPRGIAKSESDSPSPLQNSRLSLDRSPRPAVAAKPAVDRRSPKLTTPPEKQPTRLAKGSLELQNNLNAAQEDLKKAKEQIVLVEKEKIKAIDELKEAQKLAEEANEKLREALVAQKRAEENSEIEKFRAVELEQAGIEANQKKEDEWVKEIESVRSQHAVDVAALLSTTEELQRLKHELAMTCDAKNQALSHADDATKIAEIQAEKAEVLSAELARLKTLLDSKLEAETSESQMVSKLNAEMDSLRQELEKAMGYKEMLIEKEASIEQLNVELEAARMAESYARSLVEEWKIKVEELEMEVEKAHKMERSASESLDSVMKQLEGSNDMLHEAETEISALKEKMGLLEITIGRQKGDIEESERCLGVAKEENTEMAKTVESLKCELESVKEEKIQALSNEKLAASSVQNLLEEKNKLINDLENSRNEEEKSKKAMESLASALHEVSAEARENKEKLLANQAEHDSYESQIEDLRLVLKGTNEKYETLLDEAKHEIDHLTSTLEHSKNELENSKVEWEEREHHMVTCLKKSEQENSSMEKEVNRLVNLLKQAEEEADAMKEEEAQLKDGLKEVESEVIYLQESLSKAKAESLKLKESVLDKENELQSVIQENEELRAKEDAALKSVLYKDNELHCAIQENEELRAKEEEALKRVDELSKLLEEALVKKQAEENGEVTDIEKDYDLLPKVVEFSEENGHVSEEQQQQQQQPKIENFEQENKELKEEVVHFDSFKFEALNGKSKEDINNNESKDKDDETVEVEFKMWESCKIEKKEFLPERETPEHESLEEEVESKVDSSEAGFDKINGVSSTETIEEGSVSPSKQQQQKKKKPLLKKFGSLLKKKGSSNSNNNPK
ncbi:WEB family protein At3g02930, chloroplastic-like isoform X2 [Cannabis sativa]|uniref:WEB family protein At3g02930, chloroplastic-like isoform X2 n=1 Tax=Cannabis sativa TaxID=3483 RepID=UPI0029CA1F60|nr:WEB family protein At3g02930, chloroplastic-like isoform X2 [Cannabis sativa]